MANIETRGELIITHKGKIYRVYYYSTDSRIRWGVRSETNPNKTPYLHFESKMYNTICQLAAAQLSKQAA